MSQQHPAPSPHDLPPAQLVGLLQRSQARIAQLEQENNTLRNELRWIDKLLAVPASVMSPSHKVTLRAVVKAYQQTTPGEDGLIQIEAWKLCQTVGQSKQTFLDNITYLTEQVGVLQKKRERIVDSDTNDFTTNLYIGVTPLLAHPHLYKVDKPRNHGGERQICPHCKSDRLQRKVTITCMDCGSVLETQCSPVNQGSHLDTSDETQESASETDVNLTTDITSPLERQVDDSARQEPTTPPTGVDRVHLFPGSSQDTDQRDETAFDQAKACAEAVKLLVEIAGPEPVHIEMSDRGPKKYYEVKHPLNERDALAHLKGWKTKGAYLRHPGGMTRALCYDADTAQDWEDLLDAARLLATAGYRPIMEDSPAGRGGHLWIVYTRQVKAEAAHRHLLEVAPMLQHIKERWPSGGAQKVRLPGGKYVKPGFAQWCKLYDAHGAQLAANGQEAVRILLNYQTPADIIPDDPDPEPVGQAPGPEPLPNGDEQKPSDEQPQTRQAEGSIDVYWQHKYNQHLWFQFTPAQLAAWYNERHHVQDILPSEKNGMGLATWRGERTASVGLRETGWVDFGASARRPNGKPDGGDALELTVRLTEDPKPEVMRQIARELLREARAAMESAARKGELPPEWVQQFMSPTGWERYHQLREEAKYPSNTTSARAEPTPQAGGVAGFYTGSMQELERIRDYGQAHEWPALVIDGEEIIPAGRANWLAFVWLSNQQEQQRRVYEYLLKQGFPQ